MTRIDITTPIIEEYAAAHSSPEPLHLAGVARFTRERLADRSGMLVGQLEGRFLKMLVAMIRARRVLEIGTFTGYSALSMAEALPGDGRIICLDIDEEHVEIARRHISDSPYADRIEVRLGPALGLLRDVPRPIDFAFVDADKGNYEAYFEAVLPMLSEGGFMAFDNVLWSGRVLDETDQTEDTVALRRFNEAVVKDDRVECVMVPIRDGVTLVRKL